MNQFKNIKDNKYIGGDTDSVILSKPLNNKLVGSQLGQFKLEAIISEGFYLSKKFYLIVTILNDIIIKCKGINNANQIIKYNTFIELFKGNSVEVSQTRFIRKMGELNIQIKDIKHIIKPLINKHINELFNKNRYLIIYNPNSLPLTIIPYLNKIWDIIIYKPKLLPFIPIIYIHYLKIDLYKKIIIRPKYLPLIPFSINNRHYHLGVNSQRFSFLPSCSLLQVNKKQTHNYTKQNGRLALNTVADTLGTAVKYEYNKKDYHTTSVQFQFNFLHLIEDLNEDNNKDLYMDKDSSFNLLCTMNYKKEEKSILNNPIKQVVRNCVADAHINKLEIFYSSLLFTRKMDFESIDLMLENAFSKDFYSSINIYSFIPNNSGFIKDPNSSISNDENIKFKIIFICVSSDFKTEFTVISSFRNITVINMNIYQLIYKIKNGSFNTDYFYLFY